MTASDLRGTGPQPGARSKREQQRLETRELLYRLAIEEFKRVGVAKARIRAIVEAAGVVPGTFYFHFPTKQHVLVEMYRRNSLRVVELLPPPRTPLPRFLHALGDAMIDVENEVGDPDLVVDAVPTMLHPPSDVDYAGGPIYLALSERLSRAEQRGELPEDLSSDEIAHVLLVSITGALALPTRDPEQRRAELQRVIGFLIKGLRAPASSAA